MKNKVFLLVVLCFGSISLPIYSQGLFIETHDGIILSKQLESVNSLSFPNHNLVVENIDNTTHSFNLLSLKKIYFDASSVTVEEEQSLNANKPGLFPNPVSSYITITQLPAEAQEVQIYSAQGKQLITTQVSATQNQIQVEILNPGLYFLRIENQTLKFVKL